MPVILYDVRKGKVEVICGQGPAPAGATIKHYRDELGLDLVPGTGLLAACIPGTFETWMLLLRDYGTMRLADVLTPAIGYARNGHPLVERASATIGMVQDLFREHWPTSAAVFLPGNKVPAPGTHVQQRHAWRTPMRVSCAKRKVPAATAKNRSKKRASAGRSGFVAEAIDKFCRTQEVMDTSGERHRGVLTADDMAAGSRRIEPPATLDYGDYTVCKCGPWSQGPAMLQQLALIKQFDLGRIDPTDRRLHPHAGRMLQARLCRPRQFLRRSGFRRGAARDAAVRRIQRRAQETHRRARLARAAAGNDRRAWAKSLTLRVAGRRAHGRGRRGRADSRQDLDTRRHARSGRHLGRGRQARCRRRHARRHRAFRHHRPGKATWCRRRRPAAGCNPRRRSRSSAFAWARARSSSGSTRAILRRWRRANARARR